jgi:glyoxylate/hydroxypyruvate reductase A
MAAAPIALLALPEDGRAAWRAALSGAAAAQGVAIDLREGADPAAVAYLIWAPDGPQGDLRPFTGLRAILSVWAGVEKIVGRPDLPPGVPLCRMVEPGLTLGMRDYVVAHVMRRHMDLDATLRGPGPRWGEPIPPLARDRRVGVLGLGELGGACATALAGLGFDVAGWSRGPRALAGVRCLNGADGLDALLARSEILVGLLPATPQTENLLDAARLARLPRGASVVNAGRGGLFDDRALLAALDSGALAQATLDVFRVEPLPEDHPFRAHPRITVTPHVASATRPSTAAPEIIAQIARDLRGEPLRHVVDMVRGY